MTGCDHTIVPPSELSGIGVDALAHLIRAQKAGEIDGALLIRTCNRIELLVDVEDRRAACGLVREVLGADVPWREDHGAEAVRRLLRIASGLESMMVGEPQILGQVSRAFNEAEDKGLLSRTLHKLRTRLLSMARSLRAEVWAGSSRCSVADLGVEAAWQRGARVGVLGAGETAHLALELLHRRGAERPLVINRTLARAEALARHFDGAALSLDDFRRAAPPLDALICAVDSDVPLVTFAHAERIGRIVDLSRPSVCEPGLAAAGFDVVDLDALVAVADVRSAEHRRAAERLATHIDAKYERLFEQVHADRAYLGNVVELHLESALAEVEQALRGSLKHLEDQDRELLRSLTRRLAKRHAHYHILDLKQLGVTP